MDSKVVKAAAWAVLVAAVVATLGAGYWLVQISVLQKVNLAMQAQGLSQALRECQQKGAAVAPPSQSPGRQ